MESLVMFLTAPNKRNGLSPDFSIHIQLLKISIKIIQQKRGGKVNTEANTPYLEVSERKIVLRCRRSIWKKWPITGFLRFSLILEGKINFFIYPGLYKS